MHKQVQDVLAHLVMVFVQELVHLKRRLMGLWLVSLTYTCLQPGCSKGVFPALCGPSSSPRFPSAFHPRREQALPSGLASPHPLHPAHSSRRGTIQTGPHFLLPILQMKIRPKWRQKLEILCHDLHNSDHMTPLPVTGCQIYLRRLALFVPFFFFSDEETGSENLSNSPRPQMRGPELESW